MTKRTVTTKRRGTKPTARTIEAAAKRAGIKPATPNDAGGLTDEDRAIIGEMDRIGLRSSTLAGLVTDLRSGGHENETIARRLRWEAGAFDDMAKRLTVKPETRDSMLTDALECIDAAEKIFHHDGVFGKTPEAIMVEALRSAESELDGFVSRLFSGSGDDGPDWQEAWRMGCRLKLARKLAEFRRVHGEYQPAKKDEQNEKAVAS